MSSSSPVPPLMAFDEGCRLVVEHLKREVPMAAWLVSRYEDDKQIYVYVQDDVYGKVAGGRHAWSDSFCQYVVAGVAPQIAPDAMSVPEYAAIAAAHDLEIGAYIGVPIRTDDGALYGTLCGFDPAVAAPSLTEHAPLLHLFATLLGQILHADNLRAQAANREARLRWSAFHDDLTSLPNRAMFFDRVEHALDLHSRDGRPVAVLLIDLDDFKAVNDAFGHAAGDDLLALVAGRLQRAVRPGDTLARLSGDEFAVLLEDTADPTIVAARLTNALTDPFVVAARPLTISGSIGIAALDEEETADVEAVLAHADIAMYTTKHAGKGGFTVYDPLMTLPGSAALQLREPLRHAIVSGEVEAHFQPIVDITTGTVIAFEALARWRHEGRYVGPDVFVPVAVRSGLMPTLTDHMLELACCHLARWSTELGHRDLRVSVNVSPQSLADTGLPDRVAQHLRRHDLGPDQLVLEITEDALLQNPDTATAVAHRLRRLGVVLSLDDFGVGYSSLLHLRQIPLDSIKIDRGFAGDVDTDPDTEQFMRALLHLGRDLGLRVVVEGVERREQVEVLRRIGGRFAQGHLFGRPVPPQEVRLPLR